jgi:hypothetical protein
MLSSPYAEKVLETLTKMPVGQSFLIDTANSEQFRAAVNEITLKGIDRMRGFKLEPNANFTRVYKDGE